ncbi:hypothetical protein KIPE111705_01620 [Kibdelosporangium persicum]|uniref:Lipoprotein n=1 Tax=Kibdelosporangium persicum TaxID=2698649 RepID=A0ABX2F7G9_9PSEU|nr:hypothetical protein [Kibdelosporangium persicum]NRN66905.1 hypothetical protein [Kibdelosporangium persicum]
MRRIIAALAVCAAAAGCTTTVTATPVPAGDVGTTSTKSTTSRKPTATSTPQPYLTETPVLEINEAATKPGTKLKFGTQGVVPAFSRYAKGNLGVTVTVESVKAPDADIDKLPLKEEDKAKLRGKNFFYVRAELENLDGVNFTGFQAPIFTASTKSGGFPGTLLGTSKISVTGCAEALFAPDTFTTKGAKFPTCRLYFGLASDPITSLRYGEKPYDRDPAKAVTWQS